MGCYDMVFLEIECPFCGLKSEIELQTKDLEQMFCVYRKGDRVKGADQFKYLNVTGCCHSPTCQERADKAWIAIQGSPSGFGALFYAKVKLKNGIVTGKIFDIKIDEDFTEESVNKVKDKWKGKYKTRKESDQLNQLWEKTKSN